MTDRTLALAATKRALRKADHAYDTAILAHGYAERALRDADHVLRNAASARIAACAAICVVEYRRQYPD